MTPRRVDPATRAPLAVPALVAANLVVFGFELWLALGPGGGPDRVGHFVESWGLVPREFLRGVVRPGDGMGRIWLTPLTALFIHGGLLHLAANLLVLAWCGVRLEARLGAAHFAALYLACGAIASAAQIASDPSAHAATIGASGAVAGVLGAWIASGPGPRPIGPWLEHSGAAALLLLAWIGLQLVAGLNAWSASAAPVASWAHLGGFAAGVALVRPLWVRPPAASRLRI